MVEFVKLDKENIGLAFSCTRDHNLWGSEFHQKSNKFMIDNIDYKIYGIGAVRDKNPVGHAVLVDAKPPLSPVDAPDSLYLHCIYVSLRERNSGIGMELLKSAEKLARSEGKRALFLNSIGMNWMSRDFFEKSGFCVVNEDGLDSTMMKSFGGNKEFRILKDIPKHEAKTNTLLINHNPLCPLMLYRFTMLARTVAEELKEVDIVENNPEKTEASKEQLLYGVYFNNLPILVDEKRLAESVSVIKSLIIRI